MRVNLRKIFSFLRTTSTLLAIASLFTFCVESNGISSHEISHAIQQTQAKTTQSLITTDGCDVCRANSFLVGNETFLPRLETFTFTTVTEVIPAADEFTPLLCVLPPARAPPVA